MRQKICLILLSFMLLSYSAAIAQDGLPQNAPTPTATSLGRYGDIPVSYYTGNPGISIPLYTMNSRGLEMPISLTYDASGIQLNALPGWVGHSWTLQVGGVITRQTNGRDDETVYSNMLVGANFLHSYIDNYSYLYNCLHSLNGLTPENIWTNENGKQYDLEPDVFIFNFMGKTGRFFLDHTGQWRVLSEDNLEIINDIEGDGLLTPFIDRVPDPTIVNPIFLPKTFKGFKIRDDRGYIYEFGYSTNAIDYSTNFFMMTMDELNEYWHATSWYLTKVYDKLGNLLYQLNYERGKFVAQLYNMGSYQYKHTNIEFEGVDLPFTSVVNSPYRLDGQLHAPVYLKSIESETAKAVFDAGPNIHLRCDNLYVDFLTSELTQFVNKYHPAITPFYYLQTNCDSIVNFQYNGNVKDYDHPLRNACSYALNSLCITDMFNQADTISYTFQYDYSSRMHLVRLKKEDGGMSRIYNFDYNNFNLLPSNYLTNAIDHWGYYNGRDYFSFNSFPTAASYEYNRRPDGTLCMYGMLTKITYPTGGVSKIEYEPHSFSRYINRGSMQSVDSTGIGGGVRVKSITEYEDVSMNKVLKQRSFSYIMPSGNVSSGELFSKPCYYWPMWKGRTAYNGIMYVTTFQTASIIPLANSFGPSIGYSYVEEELGDGSKTIYHFTNISSVMDKPAFIPFQDPSRPSPYDKFTERGYKRGKLLDVSLYNSSSTIVAKTTYTYRTDNEETDSVPTSHCNTISFDANTTVYTGGVYNLLYPRFYVTKKTETIYNENESITTVTDYAYDYNRNTLVQYINMNGQTKTHYVNTTLLQNERTVRNSQSSMKVYSYSSAYSNDKYVDLKSKYHDLRPSSVLEYVNNYNVLTTSTVFRYITANGRQVPVPAYTLAKYNGGSAQDSLYVYDDYTSTGTLKEYHQKDGQHVYLGYAYNDNYLVWKGIGTLTAPISFTESNIFDPDALYTQLRGNYTGQNDDLMLTVYSYYPLFGIKSITEPNGYITYYDVEHGFLRNIIDNRQRTLQHFDYNYRIR